MLLCQTPPPPFLPVTSFCRAFRFSLVSTVQGSRQDRGPGSGGSGSLGSGRLLAPGSRLCDFPWGQPRPWLCGFEQCPFLSWGRADLMTETSGCGQVGVLPRDPAPLWGLFLFLLFAGYTRTLRKCLNTFSL